MLISELSVEHLARHWNSVGVERLQHSCQTMAPGSEFAHIMAHLGLPQQQWWPFRFSAPPVLHETLVTFGDLGPGWPLQVQVADGRCLLSSSTGLSYYANRSFLAFCQSLVLFDRSYRRHLAECPGDTGDDWARGDLILATLESDLRTIDPAAFTDEQYLWPYLLVDLNG